MKKKRLSVFSLLIALTLTLGACDDLEDLFPTGSDSDESTEVAGDEDPSSGENPNEDENEDENDNGNNDDENPNDDDDKGGNEPVNKDVTITLSTTSITVKENETAYFSVSLSDSEASILTVSPENAAYIEVGSTETASEYYVKGLAAGTTSITITAGGEGFNTASASISVTIDYADSFTYQMYVENEESVPLTGWYYNSEASFTFAPKLNIYNRDELTETKELTTSEVELSVTNDEGTASNIINIDGLTISPAGAVGVVTLTLSYRAEIDGTVEPLTYTISIDEVYSETHSVAITEDSVPESITVGESGFDIGVKLTTVTTAGSTSEETTSTVDALGTDVSITFNPAGSMTAAGLHIIPSVVSVETEVTITVTWTAYSTEEGASATATIKVVPKEDATYTLSITNENDFTDWYSDDSEKTMEISIVSSDETEGTIDTSELISDGKIATSSTDTGVATVDGLTITPVAKGETTILVYWTEHTEAHATLSLSILEHSYKLEITNKEELEAEWSIEDGARSLSISLTSDREDIDKTVSASNVTITYDTNVFSSDDNGFTLTPISTATDTVVTATWTNENYKIGSEGTDSFTVTINDNVKVTDLSLDYTELSLEYGETGTLTASLTGLEGKTATSTDVTWTSDSDDVIVSGNGLTATVISYVYGASATITATSVENSEAKATCTVNIAEQNVTMATYVNEYFVDEVMTSPDNEGVYVFGDGNGIYASSLTTTTAVYNSAAPIRVKKAEEGYYLLLNEEYLTSSLTTSTSAEDAAIFTISEEGVITTGSSTLGFNGASLVLESVDTSAYLIDYVTKEATENTSGGKYYLGAFNGVRYKYASAFNSNNLSVTEDANSALEFTLESAGGNLYYLSYMNGDTRTYVKITSTNSNNNLGTSTTASGCELTFDPTSNAWTHIYDEGGNDETAHALIYSSQSDVINGYKASNIGTTNYYVATLIHVPDAPDAKGIGLNASELTVNANETLQVNSKVYPSCVSDNAVSWSSDNESYAIVDESGLVSGISAADEVVITATSGSVSSSITIKVEAADETLIGIYDFALSGNTASDSNAASDDNLKAMIQASWSGSGSDPLSSVSASNCFRGAGGTSDSYPVQETKAAIKMCSSKYQGTMSLTFGQGTGIQKVVITACGYDGNSASYTLSVGTSSSDVTSQQMKENAKDASLVSVSDVSSYEWDFGSASDSIYLAGNISGSTAYRILVFSIAIYNA